LKRCITALAGSCPDPRAKLDPHVAAQRRFHVLIRQRRLVHRQAVLAPGGPHVDEHGLALARRGLEPLDQRPVPAAFTFSSTLEATSVASTNRLAKAVGFVSVVQRRRHDDDAEDLLDADHPGARLGQRAMPAPAIGHGIAMPAEQERQSQRRRVAFACRLLENSTT
jgi:hypothetical protein